MQATIALPKQGTWTIDPSHSSVGAVARHLIAAKVRGAFTRFDGTIEIGASPAESSVAVTIDASSIDTGSTDRDNHLRSADFLDVEHHPSLTFASTAVRDTTTGYEVDGELTMRGVTKPVTLSMEFLGLMSDPWGNEKALFSATARLEREQWGLTWNAPLETGGVLVSKTFDIEIDVQAALAQ